jgi:hypothetical protein
MIYEWSFQLFEGLLRPWPVSLIQSERWTLKISAEEKVYLFYEGFLLVLFDSHHTKCMQSYKSKRTEELTKVL